MSQGCLIAIVLSIRFVYDYNIKPIIDIRNMLKDPVKIKMLLGYNNIAYNYRGIVFCCCTKTNKRKGLHMLDLRRIVEH